MIATLVFLKKIRYNRLKIAEVVELVDTQVSDACGVKPVEVRVLFSAR